MDLPPWYDDQGYESSFAYESEYYTGDDLLGEFSFRYGRDILEEDALNEKSCMQVLKIWIDKADEDIMQLEEDMLQCHQLAWEDEQWSKQCCAALREKITRLDLLMESMKKDNRESGLQSETEELPPRLHDLLKPLLESYLAKSKQIETETGIIQTPAPTDVEPSIKKSKEKAGVLKTYERKSKSIEPGERRISLSQQEKNAVIRNLDASGEMCTNNELSEKVMSKASALEGSRLLNLVPIKLESLHTAVNYDATEDISLSQTDLSRNGRATNRDSPLRKSPITLLFTTFLILSLMVMGCSSSTNLDDTVALQELFVSFNYSSELHNWSLESGDPCEDQWRGVHCSFDGVRVVGLKLPKLGLTGQLDELPRLQNLEYLDLSSNGIEGSIPDGLSRNLKYLNLSFNKLTGNIPVSFQGLQTLSVLNLACNKLNGTVMCLVNLPLMDLDIESNHFSGEFPKKMLKIPVLRILKNDFDENIVHKKMNRKSILLIVTFVLLGIGVVVCVVQLITKILSDKAAQEMAKEMPLAEFDEARDDQEAPALRRSKRLQNKT